MRILHTADIHLGSNTYGRLDPQTGLNTRLIDFKRSFDFMVEHALEADIDVFLFCGDAYRTADPTPTQQRTFAECLKPIADAGIPIVMITGNHDHPVSFGKASAIDIFQYVTGDVQVFRKPDKAVIETGSGPLQLIAMPWPIRSLILSKDEHRKKSAREIRDFIEATYADFIANAARSLDPALPTVLAGHFSVQGSDLSGSERTSLIAHEPKFQPSQLTPSPIDYVALGHIHRFQNRSPNAEDPRARVARDVYIQPLDGSPPTGSPPVVYSSSLERISFKEWDDLKGFVLVDIEANDVRKTTSYTFIDTPARRFVPISVDAREAAEPTELILRAIEKADVADAVVRVRYHIEEAQVALVDTPRLREALRESFAIAAIERTVDPVERQRRTVVRRETSLEEAMRHYIAQHDHLASIEDDLVTAALDLEATYDAERRSS